MTDGIYLDVRFYVVATQPEENDEEPEAHYGS